MPTHDERLTLLEARMDAMSDLRSLIAELRGDINGRFTEVNARFTEVNVRFTELRADMNARFEGIDRRFEGVNGRLATLDQKADRHFTWMVSTQVAVLLAVVGALLGAYYR